MDCKDRVVVQPTGSGKSMCFSLLPLLLQKTTLVISPTISLMTNQVKKLCDRGVEATFLGTAQADKDVDKKIMKGDYALVFTTSESFFNKGTNKPKDMFIQMLEEAKLYLVAIDEAHLIVSWKDFR